MNLIIKYEDVDSDENIISLELNDELLVDFVSSTEIDWVELNSVALSYPYYCPIVKDEIFKKKIEIPDLNYWTTIGIVI